MFLSDSERCSPIPPGLQRICMILGLNLDSVFGSWSFKKKGWDKCLQKPLTHDAKLILEILLFGSWSSKLPGLSVFCMILGLNPDSGLGSLSSNSPGLQRNLGTDSVLGSLILQTTWFTAYLHDFGTKSRFRFGTLTYPPNHLVYSVFAWFWDKIQIYSFRTLILQSTWFQQISMFWN